jgi:hypothetical protein
MKNYSLEIYEPGSALDVVVSFETDIPVLGMSKGEIINPRTLPNADHLIGKLLKITNVEHMVWYNESKTDIKHKICVFTESVSDTAESRLKL